MSITAAIIVLAVCLVAEAFFSGAELALISANKVTLHTLAEQRSSGLLKSFLADPSHLISTALVGTNICVVLSTVVATLTLLPHYPQHAELLSLALMTPLVLVFGEIIPKSLFQHFADRLAPRLVIILSGFRIVFFPLVALGMAFSRLLLRLFGIDERRDVMSRAELRLLIQLPSRKGEDHISGEEKKMISRIFTFTEKRVEDVMLPLSEVTALPVTASITDVAREISDKLHTRIPLYRDRLDQIEGIVHAFDVLRADLPPGAAGEGRGGAVLLCRPAIFVPESQPAVDTFVRLQREGQGMAVVVDEYGGAIGVVTMEDILEEVVGEIEDEYDRDDSLIRREAGGQLLVKGRASVEVVNAKGKLQLPDDEEYETIAGLLLEHAKKIPAEGYELKIGGVVLVVTRATERSIEEVRIESSPRTR
ncbi:MAG: HlyC/CorC family transporter [Deltaproteobacteria bacterium]|nr:HlyC/CorC family transporter [Deltaproteobacteria bacterium]